MFTIITATLNAGSTLERAIASLAAQDQAFQHLVVDGGSRDGTEAICRRGGVSQFVAAPGSSIYQAWNIGLERATGRFIMFLNADDEFLPDALRAVAAAFAAAPSAGLAAGRAELVTGPRPEERVRGFTAIPDGVLDVRQMALGVPAINAIAFRADVFAAHGHFPTHFRAAGDRAFLLRLAMLDHPPGAVPVDALLYRYYSHPGSLTLHRSLKQRIMIAREHFALASELLRRAHSPAQTACLRFWRRREAGIGTVRSLAAGRLATGAGFAARLAQAEWQDLTHRAGLDQ